MAIDPAIQIGTGRGNAVISPQAGLYIQPTAPTGSSGSILNIGPSGQIPTYSGADPSIIGVYLHAIYDTPGVATANNFFVLYNPVGSTKIVVVEGVTFDEYTVSTVTAATSMLTYKFVGAPTGGTQIPAASINRFYYAFPDPQAQVFVGNPTVTGLNTYPLIGFPPALGTGGPGSAAGASPTPGASFILAPGHGVVWRQPSGDPNQRNNIQMIWAEK